MVNCGCKPCLKPIQKNVKTCKPFTLCVGNKSLVYDGKCLSVLDRQYKIPNGTYTSITFEEGCIIGVGLAPVPEYTPQACCEGEAPSKPTGTDGSMTAAKGQKNLAIISNGAILVEPQWGTSKSITLTGDGTADKPWLQEIKLSKSSGNRLVVKNDGLYANIKFGTSDNVTITGSGTEQDPWKFKIEGADAKLPEVNKTVSIGNGFEIDKFGRVVTTGEVDFVTNLEFSSQAFSVVNAGTKTQVIVDEYQLRTGSSLTVQPPLRGRGIMGDPLKLNFDEMTVLDILNEIDRSIMLKNRLKAILGI